MKHMKDILKQRSKEIRLIAAGTLLSLGGAGLAGCGQSDMSVLDQAVKNYKAADVSPDDCSPFRMGSGGVHENLIRAIKENPDIEDINDLAGGVRATASDINQELVALHKVANDGKDKVQTGDKAMYCVTAEGVVIAGDPTQFAAVS